MPRLLRLSVRPVVFVAGELGERKQVCCDSTASELPRSAAWQPGEVQEELVGLLPGGWGLRCPVWL